MNWRRKLLQKIEKKYIIKKVKGKGKGILIHFNVFNVGSQTGKDCLLTWADGVKVADCRDRTHKLLLRKRCTNHCTTGPHNIEWHRWEILDHTYSPTVPVPVFSQRHRSTNFPCHRQRLALWSSTSLHPANKDEPLNSHDELSSLGSPSPGGGVFLMFCRTLAEDDRFQR